MKYRANVIWQRQKAALPGSAVQEGEPLGLAGPMHTNAIFSTQHRVWCWEIGAQIGWMWRGLTEAVVMVLPSNPAVPGHRASGLL